MKPLVACVNCILVPIVPKEIPLLIDWIKTCPSPTLNRKLFLVLSIDGFWGDAVKKDIMDIWRTSRLRASCADIHFINCAIPEDESVYIKKMPEAGSPLLRLKYGLKSGPNQQFFKSHKLIFDLGLPVNSVLQLETDAYPLVDHWVDKINSEIADFKDPIILGSKYRGNSRLLPDISNHINGNAIYCHRNSGFKFFLNFWETLLVEIMPIAPHLAYDVLIEWCIYYRRNKDVWIFHSDEFNKFCQLYSSGRYTLKTIINFGGAVENSPDFNLDPCTFFTKFPECVIAHGHCFRKAISALFPIFLTRYTQPTNVLIGLIQKKRFDLIDQNPSIDRTRFDRHCKDFVSYARAVYGKKLK